MVDFSKPTKEQIAEGLRLLAKKVERDEKVARGELKPSFKKVSEMTAEEKAAYTKSSRRATLKAGLIVQKAKAAGIQVSEAEIDAEYAKKYKD
jgi:hypothetical protein